MSALDTALTFLRTTSIATNMTITMVATAAYANPVTVEMLTLPSAANIKYTFMRQL